MGKKELIKKIAESVKKCSQCRLHRTRTKAVPGEGNINAKIMFVGQCPGYNEDQSGRPFVGKAGALLSNLIKMANLDRSNVFITNIVKCRPPENRDPMVDEVRNCEPYLEGQIKLINPKIIVTLGRFATAHFIKDAAISEVHGNPLTTKGRIIYPLYHPAAALRSETVAQILERDFTKIPALLEKNVTNLDAVKNNKNNKEHNNQLGLI